ncbi:MAG: hypothetical protein Q9217_006121 [Psora testacea]
MSDDHNLDPHPSTSIEAYLRDWKSLPETIDRLAAPIEELYDAGEVSEAEGSLWETWQIFNSIVTQIPHDDPAQMKLVELLKGLKQRPTQGERPREIWGLSLWADLPMFGAVVREIWNDPAQLIKADDICLDPGVPGVMPDTDAIIRMRWIRNNAFIARLTTLPYALEFDLYAIWAMHTALEEQTEGSSREVLSRNVAAAGIWIFYAGEYIWRNNLEWEPKPL